MTSVDHRSAERPEPDGLLTAIADYVAGQRIESETAYETARYCLLDSLACAFQALSIPACTKVLGPMVPGAELRDGARVPGTSWRLDPVTAAFNIGTLVRWLDFNDTWLAAEWGHPSDNLGAILAVADYLGQGSGQRRFPRKRYGGGDGRDAGTQAGSGNGAERPARIRTVHDILTAMIKAHEIQGVLALQNSFNRVGYDHVLLVRIASTAVATHMLGGTRDQVVDAVSNAWIDGGALRAYRHAPNTGSRKSWAAGDATSRAVRLALLTLAGEMGYPSALSAPRWGFSDVIFGGQEVQLARPLGSYVMENVLFKISFPAEFHAQTAVEAALSLHPAVRDRLDDIVEVAIETQEPGVRIIDKTGPLHNPADRDHCIQYMVAIGLVFGELTARHYDDEIAVDPRIDALRDRMTVRENPAFTRDYYDPEKRFIGNAIQVRFNDGSSTDRVEVHFPIGHRRRRDEGLPMLMEKFRASVQPALPTRDWDRLWELATDQARLEAATVDEFMGLLAG